jgi:hypothetical protein
MAIYAITGCRLRRGEGTVTRRQMNSIQQQVCGLISPSHGRSHLLLKHIHNGSQTYYSSCSAIPFNTRHMLFVQYVSLSVFQYNDVTAKRLRQYSKVSSEHAPNARESIFEHRARPFSRARSLTRIGIKIILCLVILSCVIM